MGSQIAEQGLRVLVAAFNRRAGEADERRLERCPLQLPSCGAKVFRGDGGSYSIYFISFLCPVKAGRQIRRGDI
jgi:hypothetical protein